jgi:hypothetical protein
MDLGFLHNPAGDRRIMKKILPMTFARDDPVSVENLPRG